MGIKEELKAKGYWVDARNLGPHWKCDLAIDNLSQSFNGPTENEAIARAAAYVEEAERRFTEQQRRLRCEGCGE